MSKSAIKKVLSRFSVAMVLMVSQLTPYFVFAPQASAGGVHPRGKAVLCHATGSASNPYEFLEISVSAFVNAGHSEHDLDIVPPGLDVLPGGLNWDAEGMAIFEADCVVDTATTVKVVKSVKPSNNTSTFDLFIDGELVVDEAGNNDASGDVEIEHTTSVTVKEESGDVGSLTDFTTVITCSNQDGVIASGERTGASSRQLTISADLINEGDSIVCVFNNTEKPPTGTLIVHKTINSDNGGTTDPSNFSFVINDGEPIPFEADGTNEFELDADVYKVEEVADDRYVTNTDNCTQAIVTAGQTSHCYIINTAKPGNIVVNKTVKNISGGETSPDMFSFKVNNGDSINFEEDGSNTVEVPAGTYSIVEDEAPGFRTDYENCSELEVGIGETVYCDIINTELPSVVNVIKVLTQDNGAVDLISSFSFSVNGGDSVSFDDGGLATIELLAGKYSIVEDSAPGYGVLYSDNCTGVLKAGQEVTCTITNDDLAPVVEIAKFTESLNNSQSFNFTINSGDYSEKFTLDGNSGSNTYITTKNFQAGVVTIEEEAVDNWEQSSLWCYERVDEQLLGLKMPFTAEIGGSYYCEVYNIEFSTINVTKFHDYDEDGKWDEGEPTLEDWEMTLKREDRCMDVNSVTTMDILKDYEDCADFGFDRSELTNSQGVAVFDGLYAGQYYVDEVLQDGWTQSALFCDQENEDRIRFSDDEEGYPVRVWFGETVECYVGNHRNPEVEIEKTNDTTGPVLRGAEVTFTLKVTVPEFAKSGILQGATSGTDYLPVTVTDFLTDEFEYVPGSFTAVSSLRGDLVDLGVTKDPNYASPGTWILTSLASNQMIPGEVVTLVYKAIVGATTPAASYPTTASVIGYGVTSTITATSTDDDEVVVYVPAVLGTTTTLESTGQNQYQLFSTGILLVGATGFLARKRGTEEG